MKIKIFFLILIAMLSFKCLFANEQNNKILKNKILKNIRCLICQGQSVYDSQSDFAMSMKLVVDQKITEGLSENQIYDYLKIQYGEWISYDPEFNNKTYILWGMPILLFLVGGVLVLRKLIVIK